MKSLFKLGILGLFVCLAGTVSAAIINVPADQSTIQAGIDAANSGDTVLVAPGTYSENITIENKAIFLLGTDMGITYLQPTSTLTSILIVRGNTTDSVVIKNFTFENGGRSYHTVDFNDNDANCLIILEQNTFRNNLHNNSSDIEVVSCRDSKVRIINNIFYNNGGISCVGFRGGSGGSVLRNNTMANNSRGFFSITSGITAINNIVTGSTDYGIHGYQSWRFVLRGYNNVWNNGIDYENGSPTPTDLSVDPLYEDEANSNYLVSYSSPCIDAGHPDLEYSDLDGSRSDIGFTGQVVLAPPFASEFIILNEYALNVINNTPLFSWVYYDDPSSTQYSFEMEVGTDKDWTIAEMWTTGELISTDTSITYAGLPLEDGQYYLARIRVNNGTDWGDWRTTHFQMNSLPNVPVPFSPINGISLFYESIVLTTNNSDDLENDILTYDFEIYEDSLLTFLHSAYNDIPEGEEQTSITPSLLTPETKYYWRVRCFDGYEYGNWSEPASFYARNYGVVNVPDEAASIQEAIDLAVDFDTVMVAPGIYRENIDYRSKCIDLIGSGPDVSIIEPDNPNSQTLLLVNIEKGDFSIQGFTVQNGGNSHTVLISNVDDLVIKNNIFKENIPLNGNNIEVVSLSSSEVDVIKNVFYGNGGIGCVGLRSGSYNSRIINNTMDSNQRGVFSISNGGTLINNIITNSFFSGVNGDYNEFPISGYNLVWNNNGLDYNMGITREETGLNTDPLFYDQVNNDYRIGVESPCHNTGDPDPGFNDSDGSRSDIGALPYIYNYPFAVVFTIENETLSNVINHNPQFTWVFADTLSTQVSYTLEVGSDDDWSVAENWSTSEVFTSDTTAIYSGTPLEDGATYYVRIKLYNGFKYGDWRVLSFTMNDDPTVPELLVPVDESFIHVDTIRLIVFDSDDLNDYDELLYDFEIFADAALTQKVDSIYNVPEFGSLTTYTEYIYDLLNSKTFYWHARAYDGFEYSNWSSPFSFTTFDGDTLHVPEEYSTIEEAYLAASFGDYIIVAAGTYALNLTMFKPVKMISSEGAGSTTLQPINPNEEMIQYNGITKGRPILKGFTITGGGFNNTVDVAGSSPVITKNIFKYNVPYQDINYASIRLFNASAQIYRNLFSSNGGKGSIVVEGSSNDYQIVNNTFDDNNHGVNLQLVGGTLVNNIFTNSRVQGITVGNIDMIPESYGYNVFWQNQQDFNSPHLAVPSNIFADPMYLDSDMQNFYLDYGSPCINTGHPDQQYNDPDGSRSDIGAFSKAVFNMWAPNPISPITTQHDPPQYELLPTFIWHTASTIPIMNIKYTFLLSPDSLFMFSFKVNEYTDSMYVMTDSLEPATTYWWKVQATDQFGVTVETDPVIFKTWTPGDLNKNGVVDISDLLFLVDYFFGPRVAPDPLFLADVNADCRLDISDLLMFVDYFYNEGPPFEPTDCTELITVDGSVIDLKKQEVKSTSTIVTPLKESQSNADSKRKVLFKKNK